MARLTATVLARRAAPEPSRPNEPVLTPLDPVRVLGQLLLWCGSLLLAFAAFQLWGTGLLEWRAQRALDAQFEELLADAATVPRGWEATSDVAGRVDAGPGASAAGVAATAVPSPPGEGEAIGRITIESIGLSKTIVQGVERATLRTGPGHYPTTPLPNQGGNTAIAGHRTTHGAPFFDLDKVEAGDHIQFETTEGVYRYEIEGQTSPGGSLRGYRIVDPSEVAVIGDHGDDRLTLTACHPRFSARQRIVVTAVLVERPPLPAAAAVAFDTVGPVLAGEPGPAGPSTIDPGQTVGVEGEALTDSLGWQPAELEPTVLWATITVIALHAGWALGRLWRPRWAYPLTAPIALVPLFVCFVHLDRYLPAF